jgi:hypothetical protein
MSNNSLTKFDRPLQVELKPSPQLAVFSGLIHLLAAISVAFTPQLPVLRLLLPVLVLAHFGYFIRHQVTARSRLAVKAIAWDRQRGWRVANAAGDWRPVRPGFPVFVSFRLVVVRFRVSAFRSRSAVIVADRLSDHEFRRLRVRLLQSACDPAG